MPNVKLMISIASKTDDTLSKNLGEYLELAKLPEILSDKIENIETIQIVLTTISKTYIPRYICPNNRL